MIAKGDVEDVIQYKMKPATEIPAVGFSIEKTGGTAMRTQVCAAIGAVGGVVSSALGGWDAALATLIIFMAVDYVTGLVTAGVFHASPKSENGSLESNASFKGLCRKGMILLLVLIGARLDLVLGITYTRDAVCIAFIASEAISIVENAGLMGVPVPEKLIAAIDMLQGKGAK